MPVYLTCAVRSVARTVDRSCPRYRADPYLPTCVVPSYDHPSHDRYVYDGGCYCTYGPIYGGIVTCNVACDPYSNRAECDSTENYTPFPMLTLFWHSEGHPAIAVDKTSVIWEMASSECPHKLKANTYISGKRWCESTSTSEHSPPRPSPHLPVGRAHELTSALALECCPANCGPSNGFTRLTHGRGVASVTASSYDSYNFPVAPSTLLTGVRTSEHAMLRGTEKSPYV